MVKQLTHPETGQQVKLGRLRPAERPKLYLSDYLKLEAVVESVASGPTVFDFSLNASAALSQMYTNDTLGSCTAAGVGHAVGVLTGNASPDHPTVFTDQQIIAFYSATSGYIPGNPSTDNGADEVVVLNYWTSTGISGPDGAHKIAGYMSVDASNPVEVRTAAWLFENLYFGVELPDAWISPFPSSSGFIWDVAGPADPSNGHCFAGCGYNKSGVIISTWGMLGTLTYDALSKYVVPSANGELYTVVSQDGLNRAMQKFPIGLTWGQITADFDALGGKV